MTAQHYFVVFWDGDGWAVDEGTTAARFQDGPIWDNEGWREVLPEEEYTDQSLLEDLFSRLR